MKIMESHKAIRVANLDLYWQIKFALNGDNKHFLTFIDILFKKHKFFFWGQGWGGAE